MAKTASSGTALHRLTKDELIYMATHRCGHKHTFLEHPGCYPGRPCRRGFLDIETYGLTADFGIMLCYAIKEEGSNRLYSSMIRLDDIQAAAAGDEDRAVVSACVHDLSLFDEIITFYGGDWRFDVPFIRTRAVAMGIPFPLYGQLKAVDIYPVVKRKFRLSSNRQENAARTLLGKTEKNHISGKHWRAGARGEPEALNYIMDHNLRDARDLERLYHAVIDFTKGGAASL